MSAEFAGQIIMLGFSVIGELIRAFIWAGAFGAVYLMVRE